MTPPAYMTTADIKKEIALLEAYPDSNSVAQAGVSVEGRLRSLKNELNERSKLIHVA